PSVTNETAVLSPSGNITARVAPQDLNKFLDFVGKQGKIAQHATESEDKTASVVDVEAKLKNQVTVQGSDPPSEQRGCSNLAAMAAYRFREVTQHVTLLPLAGLGDRE